MALSLAGSEKQGYMHNLTKSCKISEPYKEGQDLMLIIDLYSSRCIYDLSFIALALIVSEKLTKTWKPGKNFRSQ